MLLITGATGFIGRHLLSKFLLSDYPIIALYRSLSKKEETLLFLQEENPTESARIDTLKWRCADLTDVGQFSAIFEGVTHLIHTAAFVSLDSEEEEKMMRQNVRVTAQLVDHALQYKIEWFGHLSSIAALGKDAKGNRTNEESLWDKEALHSAYSYTKQMAETELWRGFAEGLAGCVFNPGVILGKGPHNSPLQQLIRQQNKFGNWITEGGSGFVAVEDVVQVIFEALHQKISRRRFVLVSENWTYQELIQKIRACQNKKFTPKIMSRKALTLLYRLEKVLQYVGRKRKLSPALIDSLCSQTIYDGSEITRTLKGFKYRSLDQKLRDYIAP